MLNWKHQASLVDEPKDMTVSKGISLMDEQVGAGGSSDDDEESDEVSDDEDSGVPQSS